MNGLEIFTAVVAAGIAFIVFVIARQLDKITEILEQIKNQKHDQ